jgi:hypothetical protein
MSEDQDNRIVDLLREAAPPARDPMFRLKVLERREHRQFQRRSFTMLAGALVIILVSTFAINIGGRALETTGSLAVVGAALASGYLAFRGRLLGILRRFSI